MYYVTVIMGYLLLAFVGYLLVKILIDYQLCMFYVYIYMHISNSSIHKNMFKFKICILLIQNVNAP